MKNEEIAGELMQQRVGNRSYHSAYEFIQKYGAALTAILAAPGAAAVSRETERWHTSTASLVECPFIDQKGQIDGQEKEAEGRDVRPPTSVRAILSEIPADWIPTADVINALPEPIRWYIHQLETHDVDPAGDIRALWQAREQVQQLAAKLKEAEPAAVSPLALEELAGYLQHKADCKKWGPVWEYPRHLHRDIDCTCGFKQLASRLRAGRHE